MDNTDAKIGRSMKNRENTLTASLPSLQPETPSVTGLLVPGYRLPFSSAKLLSSAKSWRNFNERQ
jgi:hypothetical protein